MLPHEQAKIIAKIIHFQVDCHEHNAQISHISDR